MRHHEEDVVPTDFRSGKDHLPFSNVDSLRKNYGPLPLPRPPLLGDSWGKLWRRIMQSRVFRSIVWFVIALTIIGCAAFFIDRNRSPQDVLDAKIIEVTKLADDLAQKRVQIKETREQFIKGVRQLEEEILSISKDAKIASFKEASEHPRIGLDLRLIEGKWIYVAELDRMDKASYRGIEDLTFAKREAEDKRLMSTVVDSAQAQELIDRINAMLQRYRSETTGIDADGARGAQPVSPEDIKALERRWESIVASQPRSAAPPAEATRGRAPERKRS